MSRRRDPNGSRRKRASTSVCNRMTYSTCKRSRCVPVNRTSKQYCRRRPLGSRNAGKRILTAWRNCNTFALEQRNSTCYMSAATLMFARSALHRCAFEPIRQYVRRSMASAWDEAHGDGSSCPRIPARIRQHYADAYTNLMLNEENMVSYTRRDLKCSRDLTCDDRDLLSGGNQWKFLTALFMASDIDVKTVSGIFSFNNTTKRLKTPIAYMHVDLIAAAKTIIQHTLRGHEFYIFNLRFRKFTVDSISYAEEFVNEVTRYSRTHGLRVHGIGMDLQARNARFGHSITGYPCRSSSTHTHWTMCNSWGDNCSTEGFIPFLRALCARRGYDRISGIYFLLCTAE